MALAHIERRILTGDTITPNDQFTRRRLVTVIHSSVLRPLTSRYTVISSVTIQAKVTIPIIPAMALTFV